MRSHEVREGRDSVMVCANPNCGAEMSRVKNAYDDDDDDD